jgi:hypothetical protein
LGLLSGGHAAASKAEGGWQKQSWGSWEAELKEGATGEVRDEAVMRSEARDEMAVSSKVRDEATACSRYGATTLG